MSDTPLIQPSVVGAGVYEEGREASPPNHGHIKSYVRRAGRMSSAQENHYAEMMPKIGVVYTPAYIDLAAVYGRNAPKILEIGTGMGETTAKIADANRQNDYLGVEVHVPGVGALCKQIAEREHTPAYILFSDDALEDMVRKKPVTLDEFSEIRGVGQLKLDKYGKVFVALIRFVLRLPKKE